jgi:hypothetical protein
MDRTQLREEPLNGITLFVVSLMFNLYNLKHTSLRKCQEIPDLSLDTLGKGPRDSLAHSK